MARPRIGLYQQTTTPNGGASPYVRPVDVAPGGLGRGLHTLGSAFQSMAADEIAIDRLAQIREEDDARVYVSAAMARARQRAGEIRRRAFDEAPDGFRGAVGRISAEWGQLRDEELARDGLTPAAQRFLNDAFDAYQPALLEDSAEQEHRARQSWRADSVRESIRNEGAAIAVDPGLYDQAVAQQRELISGLRDIGADTRRDLLAQMDEELATVTVAALVERDPAGTLRALHDPDADGPFARLSGPQRMAFQRQAQSELDRRASVWRSNVREQMANAVDRMEVGLDPGVSVDTVRNALGAEAGEAWGLRLQAFSERQSMRDMGRADLERIAVEARPRSDNVGDYALHEARVNAAAAELRARDEDPMQLLVTRGVVSDTQEVMGAIQSGDMGALGMRARARAAIAVEQGQALDMAPAPFTRAEAAALRGRLDVLTPDDRVAALESLSRSLAMRGQNTRNVYAALTAQLYSDNVGAYAGAAVLGRRGRVEVEGGAVDGRVVARRMLAGAALLNPQGGQDEAEGRNQRPRVDMPGAAALEGAFRAYVGDAYANDPRRYALAFQAFRAYYAGKAAETGIDAGNLTFSSGQVGGDRQARALAEESARAAVGEIRVNRHGGVDGLPENVYLPWGMSEEQFNASIAQAWGRLEQRYPHADLDGDPRDYDYAPDPAGAGFYTVFRNGRPVQDSRSGELVRVRPRLALE